MAWTPRWRRALPHRPSLFYGWRIVALGFVNCAMSAGVGTYAFSVFVKPMTEDAELGWSRTDLMWGVTLSIVLATLFAPIIGMLVDRRHGARVLMVLMGITGGVSLILLSQVHYLWQFYLLFGGLAALFHHLPAMVLVPTIVSKWFLRNRGRALALASMGISAGGIAFIPLFAFLISSIGWRAAWLVLGIMTVAIVVIPNGLWMRRRPEDMGLRPDGDSDPIPQRTGESALTTSQEDSAQWTLALALRTPTFWLITISSNLALAGLMGILIHQIAYLTEEVSTGVAITGATMLTVFILLGKPVWVIVADRIGVGTATAATYAISALGLVFFVSLSHPSFVFIWAVVFGLGLAGLDLLVSLLWANYYGRAFLGSIRGVYGLSNIISFAGAPLFAAFMYEATGDYQAVFIIFLGAFALAAVMMLFTRRPNPIPMPPGSTPSPDHCP